MNVKTKAWTQNRDEEKYFGDEVQIRRDSSARAGGNGKADLSISSFRCRALSLGHLPLRRDVAILNLLNNTAIAAASHPAAISGALP